MELFKLPQKIGQYTAHDVILVIAKTKKITEEMAQKMILVGDQVKSIAFISTDVIIAKSFGEIVALKNVEEGRLVQVGKFFKGGMLVALSSSQTTDELSLVGKGKKKVSLLYRELVSSRKNV